MPDFEHKRSDSAEGGASRPDAARRDWSPAIGARPIMPMMPRGAAPSTRPMPSQDSSASHGASAMERARVVAQASTAQLAAIRSTLIPAYHRAVASTDTAAVRALAAQIVGGVGHIVEAQRQIVHLVPQADTGPHAARASTADTDPLTPDAGALAALMQDKATLDGALAAALPVLAIEVSPQMFGDRPTVKATEPVDGAHALWTLVEEAETVVLLLDEADGIQALVGPEDPARATSEPASDAARAQAVERVSRWKSRPINFRFLVRVLTQRTVWQSLQGAKDQRGDTPAELEHNVAARAAETGTTADVGAWDPYDVRKKLGGWLVSGDDAMKVLEYLGQVEPHARAKLVKQLHRMGLLERMCTQLPWALVKQLWESIQDPEASKLLEPYWVDKGGGQSLGKMLDKHWYTKPINTFLDVTTFGAKPQIDAAYDARDAGAISDDDYWHSVDRAVGRAAFVATAMAATGGVAGEFAAGAATELGSGAAEMIGGASGGAVGNVGGHLAGDTYDQLYNGKRGFDPLADYAKSFAKGGILGTVTAPIGLAAAKYLPTTMRTLAQQVAAAHPELMEVLTAARACGVGVATQVRTTVRDFIASMRSGGPPGFRLAYASHGGAPIPTEIASADPSASVLLTVRPLKDLNTPAPLMQEGDEFVEVEEVSLADQVRDHFEEVGRHASDFHTPDDNGSFAGEQSRLGDDGPEVGAVQTRRTKTEAGVVSFEGQEISDVHHVFPQRYRAYFEERGIDIDRYCIRLPTSKHQVLHRTSNAAQGASVANPNAAWADWDIALVSSVESAEKFKRVVTGDPAIDLTETEFVRIARQLLKERGMERIPFVRYRR